MGNDCFFVVVVLNTIVFVFKMESKRSTAADDEHNSLKWPGAIHSFLYELRDENDKNMLQTELSIERLWIKTS